jgi:hypothetical protein
LRCRAHPPATSALLRRAALDWLGAVQGKARALAEDMGRFGVFGTSIVSWFFGQMPVRVRFFVERTKTAGPDALRGPVRRPSQVAPESVVYLCLPDQ